MFPAKQRHFSRSCYITLNLRGNLSLRRQKNDYMTKHQETHLSGCAYADPEPPNFLFLTKSVQYIISALGFASLEMLHR